MKKLLPLLMTSIPAIGWCISAAPYPIEVTQPDGSLLTVILKGDERGHALFSVDGHMLMVDDAGRYVYAVKGSDGLPLPSEVMARQPELRMWDEIDFINRIDDSVLVGCLRSRDARRLSASNLGKGSKNAPNYRFTQFPCMGEQRALVILVQTPDCPFTIDDPHAYFDSMLNEEGYSGYGATGSARDWFIENSYGQFTPAFDVYGPVTLTKPMSTYGKNDHNGNEDSAWKIVTESCTLLNDEIDFSQYDRDGDGFVDTVYVYYAGYGEADSSISNTIWPHSGCIDWMTSDVYRFDGVRINNYACSNEQPYNYDHPDGIGTFIHEFSHVMGLPDLYATTYTDSFTPGAWSVLDSGPYNNEKRTPPNYSAFERMSLGWLDPSEMKWSDDYVLHELNESGQALRVNTSDPDEFYIFENRQQVGNDRYLPGHGMLVWHIDFDYAIWKNNVVNNDPAHQCVDLVEADNKLSQASRKADCFPGTKNITRYADDTFPAFISWGREHMGAIENIAEADGLVSFSYDSPNGSGVKQFLDGDYAGFGTDRLVYTIDGRCLGNVEVKTLPSGVYVLRNCDTCQKVMVR